jgi:hypothetical protein
VHVHVHVRVWTGGELHGMSTSSRALARGLARFTPGPLGLGRGRGDWWERKVGLGGQMEVVEVGAGVGVGVSEKRGGRASMVGERIPVCVFVNAGLHETRQESKYRSS